jgi:hypothetical protein
MQRQNFKQLLPLFTGTSELLNITAVQLPASCFVLSYVCEKSPTSIIDTQPSFVTGRIATSTQTKLTHHPEVADGTAALLAAIS